MTTQELKNKIEKVLGNSIRCLLPSYWWKNLFHSVADRIDEVETTVTENVNDMVVKSLKEFEAKHPDMASSTLVFTVDPSSAEARNNAIKIAKWAFKITSSPAKSTVDPLYIAVPIVDEEFAYSIQTPMYGLGEFGVKFYNLRMPDGKTYNMEFDFSSGAAVSEEASSSSGGGSVMFVINPIGDLTEEQRQNNADAYLKVIESEFAIDINIMVMFFIAKPNIVSANNNGDLVFVSASIDGGVSKFIFTSEGDATIETVEPTSSEGVEIRELRTNSNLSDEDKAYNIETVELYKEGKALVITPIAYSQTSTERTDRMAAPFFVDLHTGDSTKLATFRFLAPNIDEIDPFERGFLLEDTVVISNDGSVSVTAGSFYDIAMSDTSTKAVQNKVIKKYIDDAIANVGGGSDIVVDTEISSTSTNPVQNKVVYSELQKKQGTISDLADIRSGAALGKTALQSVPSEYVTENELTQKGYATTSQVNDKQDKIDDLADIRAGAALGKTALQEHQDISGKQDMLVSGTNIKTINGQSIVGSGNIEIGGGSDIDPSNFATKDELNGKQDEISDLDAIRSGAALGATALQEHQDISHLATNEALANLTNEMVANEEVHAAAYSDLDSRLKDIGSLISGVAVTKEEFQEGLQAITNEIVANEEVHAAALTDLNSRLAALEAALLSINQ